MLKLQNTTFNYPRQWFNDNIVSEVDSERKLIIIFQVKLTENNIVDNNIVDETDREKKLKIILQVK